MLCAMQHAENNITTVGFRVSCREVEKRDEFVFFNVFRRLGNEKPGSPTFKVTCPGILHGRRTLGRPLLPDLGAKECLAGLVLMTRHFQN